MYYLILTLKVTMFLYIIVFLINVLIDFIYVKYLKAVENNKALQAASLGSSIELIGGVSVIFFTGNPYLLIPVILGSFVGSYLSVLFHKNSNN